MNEKHYKEKLSYFVNHELAQDERAAIAGHLLQCAECRAEHDEIKFGATLAGSLKPHDAPANLWNKIENSLDEREKKPFGLAGFAFFNPRVLTAGLFVLLSFGAIYFAFLRVGNEESPPLARVEKPSENANIAQPLSVVSTPDETISPNQPPNQTAGTGAAQVDVPKANQPAANQTPTGDSKTGVLPKTVNPVKTVLPSWNVETLAGMPRIGDSLNSEKLAVGEFLETDANSRALVQVADIGNVEIAPNSRVQLVGTKATEHRLSLEKGALKAKILAPPRLFIVDTPSAVAVDLGCEYTLEVDAEGNSRLHVTSGFVALENGKLESIVPAGAIALTRKGKGIGTPFADDTSPALQAALYKFDFENGGAAALEIVIEEANMYDSLTLWHLLARVEKPERERIFDALAAHVKPPAKVTREGVLRLDKKMLDAWWTEIENVWFG
jgi:hypothetical protein